MNFYGENKKQEIKRIRNNKIIDINRWLNIEYDDGYAHKYIINLLIFLK